MNDVWVSAHQKNLICRHVINARLATSSLTQDFHHSLLRYYKLMTILTRDIEQINNDHTLLITRNDQLNDILVRCKHYINELQSSIPETNQQLNEIHLNHLRLQEELTNVKNSILPPAVHDGSLIWKITDVYHKIDGARSDIHPYINSPPFFSSPVGYKMKVTLYLNGDGEAHCKYMSLYFMIMQGEFDSILHWPFNFGVTFCLIDQSNQQRHITETFYPDSKSVVCHRPRSDTNEAIGIQKFCSLDSLRHYIQDDVMFIKINIDFVTIPPHPTICLPVSSSTCTQSPVIATDERRQSMPDSNDEFRLCIAGRSNAPLYSVHPPP
ncbi:unnamed protein product [Didymodactylos carnosus]|uniref:MATH domain-containing protein n=1 Tax=Didymodactylos carnosus TaxID=1234261 RepID=A0A814MWW1_9BILA|nr:unnamed protein product [Didymodactylos carnosus]CAF3849306.1 unnamed protein product [Didymodactylos carnosus]